jgi:ABC-type glycerol-3-phosphate transport system substrate-binding protein
MMRGFDRTCSRRRLLGAGAALAGGLALGRTARSTAARALAAQDQITLQVFIHANHPLDSVKPLYEAKYPNVKLNYMEQSDMAVFRATLVAHGEGTPDLVRPEINDVQDLGKTGVLLDVTDLIEKHKAELAPGKVAECFIPATGKYAGFPAEIRAVGLYYREDLWQQAGVAVPADWTWDDYVEAAKTVKGKTGAASFYFPSSGDNQTALLWTYVMFQFGGSITNADGTEVTLDDDKGIAAMEQVKRIYEADVSLDEPPFEETYFQALAAGQVAGAPLPAGYRGFAIEPYVKDEQGGLGQWRVALLPRPAEGTVRVANIGGAALASTRYTEYPQEVKNFMELALGTMEGATACGEWGVVPSFLPYLASDAWKNARSEPFGDFAFNAVWTEAVNQYPGTWYMQPVFAEALNELGAQMMPMMDGEVEIAAGMKMVGDRVRDLNKRYQS